MGLKLIKINGLKIGVFSHKMKSIRCQVSLLCFSSYHNIFLESSLLASVGSRVKFIPIKFIPAAHDYLVTLSS